MESTEELAEPTVESGSSIDEDDRNRFYTVKDIATEYLQQDEVDEAVSVLTDFVGEMEQLYGDDTLQSAWATRNCGLVLAQNNKYAEAEPFLRDFFVYTMDFFEESCEATRWCQSALGQCLFKTQKFDEASHILKDLLEDQKEVLGGKNPSTLETIKYYLQSLLERIQGEETVDLLAYCDQVIETINHDDEEEVKTGLLGVGYILLDYGLCEMGRDIMDNVLAQQRGLFGPEHPETVKLVDLTLKTMLYAAQEKGKSGPMMATHGVLMLRNRWSLMKKFLGESHIDTIAALEMLADLAWGELEDESTLFYSQKVFDLRKRSLGEGHRDTISARDTLWSRMNTLKQFESSSLGAGEPAGQATGMEGVHAHAHTASPRAAEVNKQATSGPKTLGSRSSEGEHSRGSRTSDQLCKFCHDLEIVSYLGDAKVQTMLQEKSYPESEQTAKALLSRPDCPLCRLIVSGLSTKLPIPPAELDPQTKISYRFIYPEPVDSGSEESFSVMDTVGLMAEMLLLEVSVQKQRLWVYAVETAGDYLERVEGVASVSLTLSSSSSSDGSSLSLHEHDFLTSLSLMYRETEDELQKKLSHLGETYGYLKGRLVSELVDTRLLKAWLHCCDSHHNDDCKPIEMKQDSHWRPSWLIDVHKGMLVPGSEGGTAVCYAALSYVWGDRRVKQLKHTAAGGVSDSLKSPGGLTDGSKNIPPTTIRDAMDLCRQIGIPYLWVDAICLDQDNITEDVLDSMGKIYQGAYVTIVAGAGQDSWAGLGGVGRRRPSQELYNIGALSLGFYSGSRQAILKETKWASRAWTFQEMLLSKRLLIFTEKEVFYQCGSGAAWREAVFLEHPGLSSATFSIPSAECKNSQLSLAVQDKLDGSQRSERTNWIVDIYHGIVKGYLGREMTDTSDVLKALQGILTIVTEQTGQSFHKGIPTRHLFRSMLFNVTGSPYSLRRPNFPSWSWCGWQNINTTDNANTSRFKFTESPVQPWFESKVDLYWLAPLQDSNNNAGGVYSFSLVDGQNNETAPHEMKIQATNKGEGWSRQVHNMLVFSTETIHVEVSSQGEPLPWDSETLRYTVLSSGLGFEFLDLNKDWREKQPAHLELVALGRAKAFDERDITKFRDTYADGSQGAGGSFVKAGWESHLVALVAVLLVETDLNTGISQRVGLYNVEEEYWDRAVKTSRRVYLC